MKLAGCGAMLAVAVLAEGILGSICHAQAAKGEFLDCRAIHIDSPDRHWALASTCTLICPENMAQGPSVVAVCSNNQNDLFEDAFTHRRQPIAFYGFAGNAVWSPNSKAIFVNDHMGSNMTEASLYGVEPLKRIDVAQAISRADRSAARYAHGHSYYVAREWLDNQTALVQLCGHTDNPPFVQFDIRYRVGLDGTVQRILRKLTPPTQGGDCAWNKIR